MQADRASSSEAERPKRAVTALVWGWMSPASPHMRDVRIGVEADRLAVAARHCDEIRVVVLERLEQRLGGAPQRAAAADRRIVMRRHVDLGLIEPHVLQPL